MSVIGDNSMADVFKTGEDLHTETAKLIFNKNELTDEERQYGKTWNYAAIYGMGIKKCVFLLTDALKREVDKDEAEKVFDAFHERWPGIKLLSNPFYSWKKEQPGAIERRLKERGYISTLHGRHLHPQQPHKALNYLIQGTAADIMRHAIVKVYKFLKEDKFVSHIVNSVHDELILDVIKKEIKELVEAISALMGNSTVENIIPITVEVEYSDTNWADKRALVTS